MVVTSIVMPSARVDADHIHVIERIDAVVGLAQIADGQIADAQRQHQQDPKAAHQPGHGIEILKPVHVPFLLFLFLDDAALTDWAGGAACWDVLVDA